MEIYKTPLGVFQANCYIIPAAKQKAVIIDPGASGDYILNMLTEKELKPEAIILTHGHFDHVGGITPLVKAGAKVYIHADDEYLLVDPSAAGDGLFPSFKGYESQKADVTFKDNDIISVCGLNFKIMHTPGHTRGSSIIFLENVMFTGDTLFCTSIGRTDFIGSNPNKMKASLDRIKKICGEYRILPGHGEETTLEKEMASNPYLGSSYDNIL